MTAKVLRRAAELVEQGWCQGGLARQKSHGNFVEPFSPLAVEWCAEGALVMAAYEATGMLPFTEDGLTLLRGLFEAVQRVLPNDSARAQDIAAWNDQSSRTADEVAALFRRAADQCEAP